MKALAATPSGGVDEVPGMGTEALTLCLFVSCDITLCALRIAFQVARRRDRQSDRDHCLAKVLSAHVDGADRATVALLARQPDCGRVRLQQLGRIVLGGLAAGPTSRRRAAHLTLLEGVGA